MKCSRCSLPLQMTRISSVEGQEKDYHVRLCNIPVLACPNDHERWYVYEDFGTDLIDAVYTQNKNCFTERKGLIIRRDHCPRCHRNLVALDEITHTVTISIQLKQGHAFTLDIHGPTVSCKACGTMLIRNVASRTAEVSEALAQAMLTNFIKPR